MNLAPNGKPSNLTPKQYALVRTPAFKEWFGDWENNPSEASKVVDSNGEPLVVRHFSQSKKRHTIFKEKAKKNEWSVSQTGIYFTSLNAKELNDAYNRTGKGILYEVFLNIKNLLDLGIYDTYDFVSGKPVFWKEHHFEMLDKYVTKGRVGTFEDYTEFEKKTDYTSIQDISQNSKDKILKLGYNGIWGNKPNGIYDVIDELVVFYPNQIKLADGSNTTFDSNNPDIRFDNGGTTMKAPKLLAPNGKPSNLTPKQYRLVRTPAFKAWFGDWERLANATIKDPAIDVITLGNISKDVSKVVDENGEPLVVYHGSKSNRFNSFNIISETHRGVEVGSHFGTYIQSQKIIAQRKSKNLAFQLYEVFLCIKNIIRVDDINWWTPANINKFIFQKNKIKISSNNPSAKDVIEQLNKKKINGFIYSNLHEGEGHSYVVFNPNQIKLADGSNTTFDSNNPDIRFDNGGTTMKAPKLLAPNGKPSNLTSEQYRIVRTPAFKAWFGDWENDSENASKVVDENGEPLLLYRGNKGNVEELGYEFNLGQNLLNKKSNNNFGFFFTDDIKVAKSYGNPLWNFKYNTALYYVLNVFIDVKNIIDLRSLGFRTIGIDFIELLDKKNISFKGYENLKQEIIKYDRTYDKIDAKEWYTPNVYDFFDVFPKLREVFKNNKINGVVFKEKSRTSKGEITYAVFNSNQIKLADGTNTTFDGSNPDIRYSGGGYIGSCVDIGSSNKEVCEYFPNATIMAEYVGNPDENEWGKSKETTPKEFYKYVSKDDVPKKAINGEHTYHYIAQDGSNRDMNINETAIYFIYNIASDIHYFFKKTKHKTGGDLVNEPYISDNFQIGPNGAYEHTEENEIINQYADGVDLKKKLKKPKKPKGDCYYAAAQLVMGNRFKHLFGDNNITYIGTPYLVHAEVRGQGKVANIRFGHAWIEDDENIYDYSNGNQFVMPKEIYYAIGDIDNQNPLKYQKYTFEEARRKMVTTRHYGEWDLEVDY